MKKKTIFRKETYPMGLCKTVKSLIFENKGEKWRLFYDFFTIKNIFESLNRKIMARFF